MNLLSLQELHTVDLNGDRLQFTIQLLQVNSDTAAKRLQGFLPYITYTIQYNVWVSVQSFDSAMSITSTKKSALLAAEI